MTIHIIHKNLVEIELEDLLNEYLYLQNMEVQQEMESTIHHKTTAVDSGIF